MTEQVTSGNSVAAQGQVLTPDAERFVKALHESFEGTRKELLKRRSERQRAFDVGVEMGFLEDTRKIRESSWQVAQAPQDLLDRRVEITGPVERKMMINALNSGAKVFMADFEDALSPTWGNVIAGQINLMDAVRRTLRFEDKARGNTYELAKETATLVVRPRGWHLLEKHFMVSAQSVSASLFDFGLYFFHNARELLDRGSGPYFYLPKLENHLEARLWNDVFNFAQDELGLPRGTVRATVLVETLPAAFEMEEILFELKEHASGLNAGRWDYIFSFIKKFRGRADKLLPDRAQVTMTVPFMRTYAELLVKTCHKRGAHAIGGMAAFIPSRRDPKVNAKALEKVAEDKEREASQGFDGTWVAHPDLVPVAKEVFDRSLGNRPHQKERLREDGAVSSRALLDPMVPGGAVTEMGLRNNVSVSLQYLSAWLSGNGAVAIYNLMEDAATAEISRAQLWQWLHHEAVLEDGRPVTRELFTQVVGEELDRLGGRSAARYEDAAQILDALVLQGTFTEFLTLPAYELLNP